jgi:hypothetical protein
VPINDNSFSDMSLNDAMSAFDQAASHPNPAFDFLTGFVPRKLKDLFRWCEYLNYNSAHVYAAHRKFNEMAITEIEYNTANEQLRKNYKRLFEKVVKMKAKLANAGIDKQVYGNHFTSIYTPFVRNLVCSRCENMINIAMVDYKFDIKTLGFTYRCKKCKNTVSGKVVDQKILAINKLHIIRWDPKLIDIEYNPITGEAVYYYNIPQETKEKVKKGAKHLINTTPYEFLECIKNDKLFRFQKDAIFHLKVPAPAGIEQQWGFPPLASTIKLFLYTMTLRKANEAIALEHVVPMRILHPAQTGNQDLTQMINMAKWTDEMKYNIRRWRRDPLHVMFAPVPVGVANMGGDGRAMLTLGEVQEAEKNIMAALGIPPEFLFGGITKAGMEGQLRIIENMLLGHSDDLNDLLQWLADKMAKFLGWERIDVKLSPLKMVDDTETKQQIINMATGANGQAPVVSMTTMAERLGLDLSEERDKRKQEALDEAKFQQELQSEVQKLQNTLAQQVQQQIQGVQGLSYDQQAVIGKADEIVQQLNGIDQNTRKSQLHALQVEDAVMYAVVIQRMEALRNAENAQLRMQAEQGGGAQPM